MDPKKPKLPQLTKPSCCSAWSRAGVPAGLLGAYKSFIVYLKRYYVNLYCMLLTISDLDQHCIM